MAIFSRSSIFKQDIDDMFLKKYDLNNALDNDFDAILSRIYVVFNRESPSMYIPFYLRTNIIVKYFSHMSLDEIKISIIIIIIINFFFHPFKNKLPLS